VLIRLRSDQITWRAVEGEIIVLDHRNWNYVTIGESGALLWPLIAEGTTIEALAAVLSEAFGIDSDRARTDVESFLERLSYYGLVEGFG
jgi:hypothetical protein